MIHIQGTLVSEDLLEQAFCCDLSACQGGCCNSEGDSGAPLDADELAPLDDLAKMLWDDLLPRAQEVIREQGPYFRDAQGDWVTSVVDGHDCVFCTYGHLEPGGPLVCLCAIEKAFREGRFQTLPSYRGGMVPFKKPVSCHLYPVRLKQVGEYTAVNYDEQPQMCGCAKRLGRRLDMRLYQCVKEALVRRFGPSWYDELEVCAREWGNFRGV